MGRLPAGLGCCYEPRDGDSLAKRGTPPWARLAVTFYRGAGT